MALSLPDFKKRLKDIKLVVTDVDGTLTTDKESIYPETVELIHKLQEKGVTVTIATQKIYSSVKELINLLGIDVPFITSNGRYICDNKGNVITESYISSRQLDKAIKLAMIYGVKIALCNNNEIVYTKENSVITTLPHRLGTNYKLVDDYRDYKNKIVEIIFLGFERKVIREIQNKMTFPFKLFISANYFRISSRSGLYNLDVRKARVDKYTAMKKLAKHFHVSRKEVSVIGDWYNDMDLYRFGGLNIALKNAIPRLRYIADYVVNKTNNENGAGEFLKMLYDVKANG